MPFVGRLGREKLWARTIIAAATLVIVAVAFLLLRNKSAPVGATPPAAATSDQAVDDQVASEAEQTPADEGPMELPVMTLNPDGTQAAQTSASQRPISSDPKPISTDLEDHTSGAARQRMFKARRALETIDPRSFRR